MKKRDFLIVIPVADRPRQLQLCLQSLVDLCQSQAQGRRVEALILEDSLAPEHRLAHEQLCQDFGAQGLVCHYLGLAGQYELRQGLDDAAGLASLLGNEPWPWAGHKGASITRNLGYLRLREPFVGLDDPLFWFVDSDQEFAVLIQGSDQQIQLPYFEELERLFANPQLQILTGKVVGDPPVSPAVMAGTCLQDLQAFLADLMPKSPAASCSFHGRELRNATDAAYHDLAALFGFRPQEAFRYECPLQDAHDHSACILAASRSLAAFFDGVHPTRRSWYQEDVGPLISQPARTLYTGNFVMDRRGLAHAIPFAALKLRMAGPTLGRLLQARLGPGFASANLPLLHRRALEQDRRQAVRAECRPGVAWHRAEVDLSGEFERQFLGDLMLFSVERLVRQGYPQQRLDVVALDETLASVARELTQKYRTQACNTLALCAAFKDAWHSPAAWWNQTDALPEVHAAVAAFIANMERTFIKQGAGQGNFPGEQGLLRAWLPRIRQALLEYPRVEHLWRALDR